MGLTGRLCKKVFFRACDGVWPCKNLAGVGFLHHVFCQPAVGPSRDFWAAESISGGYHGTPGTVCFLLLDKWGTLRLPEKGGNSQRS